MLDTDARRWIVAAVAVIGVIALLAWARNGPGVGGREPDPPASSVVVPTTATTGDGAVVTTVSPGPPTTSV
jgi:hypothetical protein